MRIICVVDKGGRVHESRVSIFRKYLPHQFDIRTGRIPSKLIYKADVIYYCTFGLYKKYRVKHPNIRISITSHKCLRDPFLRKIRNLKASANSSILYDLLKDQVKDLYYLPNGVDIDLYRFRENHEFNPNRIVVGWIGNRDRRTKNYNIVNGLNGFPGIKMKIIATRKGDKSSKLQKSKKIRKFYYKLDFYLVASSTEGTPNPALEAASCGVPLITTRVGNMVDLVENEVDGFFIKTDLKKIGKRMKKLKKITPEKYGEMSRHIRSKIEKDWNWSKNVLPYNKFFKGK